MTLFIDRLFASAAAGFYYPHKPSLQAPCSSVLFALRDVSLSNTHTNTKKHTHTQLDIYHCLILSACVCLLMSVHLTLDVLLIGDLKWLSRQSLEVLDREETHFVRHLGGTNPA